MKFAACARLVAFGVCVAGCQTPQVGQGRRAAQVAAAPSPSLVSAAPPAARDNAYRVVRASNSHACALTESGSVRCWGRNDKLQVGPGCAEICSIPHVVPLPEPADDLRLTSGGACALLRSGRVYCWGDRAALLVPEDRRAARLVAGDPLSCHIDVQHRLVCRGWNGFGRLGFPEIEADRSEQALMRPAARVPLTGDVSSAVVLYHSGCALASSGTLSCWGTSFDCAGPQGVRMPEPVTALEGDGQSICLLTTSGAVYAYNEYPESKQPACEDAPDLFLEELGEPVALGAKAVACFARKQGCIIDGNDQVACWDWGSNPSNLVGIPGLPRVRQVALGGGFGCAVSTDGRVLCWGANRVGQLGRGTQTLEIEGPREPSWPTPPEQ